MRACILAVAFAALPLGAVVGEEPGPALYISKVSHVSMLSDSEWGKAVALIGQVTLEVDGVFLVRAQRLVVWLDPKADATIFKLIKGLQSQKHRIPTWAVRAIYAQGGRAPVLFHAGGRVFRCQEIFFDLTRFDGLLLDAEVRLQRTHPSLGPLPDLVMRAKRIWAKGPGRWTAEQVRLYASSYVDPEISIGVQRIEVYDEKTGAALGRLLRLNADAARRGVGIPDEELDRIMEELTRAAVEDSAARVGLHRVTARLFRVPFFTWKRVSTDRSRDMNLRAQMDFGGRGRMGTGVLLRVGIDDRPIGFMVGAGYYFDRGPLADLSLDLFAWEGRVTGRSYGVYLRDRGDDLGVVPPTKDRFFTLNQYRWKISNAWRLDGEFSDLSDPAWLRTWDERQFKEGKRLETLLYIRGRNETGYLTGVAKLRNIDFLDDLEELPRFAASLPVLNLITFSERVSLQLAVNAEVGNLRARKSDLSPPGPEPRTWRFDTDPTLFFAFNAGPVRVTPWAKFRFTAYEQGLSGSSLGRFAGSAGIRGDIQFARWYGQVRHAVNLSLEYSDLYSLTESGSSLFQFDDIDRITRWRGAGLRIRNRLQHRTASGLETFLTFEIFAAWFPDSSQPLGARGDHYVDLNLAWWKRDLVGVLLRSDIDTENGVLRTGSIEGWWQARQNVLVGAGIRHLDRDSDIFTFTTDFDIDSRWRIVVFSQYDFKNGDYLDQGVRILRFGRTAAFGLTFRYDPGDNGLSISFNFDLTEAFRKKTRRNRDNYRRSFYWR